MGCLLLSLFLSAGRGHLHWGCTYHPHAEEIYWKMVNRLRSQEVFTLGKINPTSSPEFSP